MVTYFTDLCYKAKSFETLKEFEREKTFLEKEIGLASDVLNNILSKVRLHGAFNWKE